MQSTDRKASEKVLTLRQQRKLRQQDFQAVFGLTPVWSKRLDIIVNLKEYKAEKKLSDKIRDSNFTLDEGERDLERLEAGDHHLGEKIEQKKLISKLKGELAKLVLQRSLFKKTGQMETEEEAA